MSLEMMLQRQRGLDSAPLRPGKEDLQMVKESTEAKDDQRPCHDGD